MNKYGNISVNAILKMLPNTSDNLLYLAIFGSQVRGTERPDSDLDVLYVCHTESQSLGKVIHDTILEAPGGVKTTTIISHTLETIKEPSNVYGSVEYHVLRGEGARTLYRSADFDITLHTEVDYEYGAKQWLELATQRLSNHTS